MMYPTYRIDSKVANWVPVNGLESNFISLRGIWICKTYHEVRDQTAILAIVQL